MRLATVQTSAEHTLLELWERAVALPGDERIDALLAAAGEAPPTSLGSRNAAVLQLRARLLGASQPLRSSCTACGATVEFTVDCAALARDLAPPADVHGEHHLETEGWHVAFRLPLSADLRAASAHGSDRDAFVRTLWQRCVVRCERSDQLPCDADALPATVTETLSKRMEALEPGATVEFDLTCPECDTRWTARMDCGAVVWSEVQACAERLLLDVDALARTYGWSEAEVLALGATRRAAYLQLIGGA